MVGNLILVTEDLNNRLANKPFAEKLEILRLENDPILKDGFLSKVTTWDHDAISNRTKHLADLSYDKMWRIQLQNTDSGCSSECFRE